MKSVWVGMRPLVKPADDEGPTGTTGAISREHTVRVSRSGLVTVTGGKWTTYRPMAEDVLARCAQAGLLPDRPAGGTVELPLLGAQAGGPAVSAAPGLHGYGSEAAAVQALPGADRWLWPGRLSEAMVRFAARHEMARSVEDVLARRCRLLFLDAALAEQLAEPVAALLAEELGRPPEQLGLTAFQALARRYRTLPAP